MEVGAPMGLKPGHTSSIRRIEASMLSYHADMSLEHNPFELGLDRLVDLDIQADYVSKKALKRIKAVGVKQYLVGLVFEGDPIEGSNDEYWPIRADGQRIGYVTSAVYSPRLEQNIALAMVHKDYSEIGTKAVIETTLMKRNCEVVPKPFYDPKKAIAAKS